MKRKHSRSPVELVLAAVALAASAELAAAMPSQPSKDGPDQHMYVEAQWAAARAPDTALADAEKQRVLDAYARKNGAVQAPSGTARDTASNNPRHGTLTKGEESTSMPKAGQVNNHSSPALEASSGRPSEGAR